VRTEGETRQGRTADANGEDNGAGRRVRKRGEKGGTTRGGHHDTDSLVLHKNTHANAQRNNGRTARPAAAWRTPIYIYIYTVYVNIDSVIPPMRTLYSCYVLPRFLALDVRGRYRRQNHGKAVLCWQGHHWNAARRKPTRSRKLTRHERAGEVRARQKPASPSPPPGYGIR